MEDVPTAIQKAVAIRTAADHQAEAMATPRAEEATDTHPKAAAMAILKEGTAAAPMATGHQEGATMQTTEEVTAILQKDVHITTAVLQRGEATETAKAEASVLQEEGLHSEHLKDLQEEDRSAAMKAEEAATSDALPREASADATTAQERASRAASRQEGTIPDRRQNRIHTDSMRLTRRT